MRGLSRSEVAERVALGRTNATRRTTSRPLAHILRDNVFTLFNGVLTACFLAVLVLGDLRDGFFYGIVVANVAIGVVQEVRAKRALDRLALLAAPVARVRRDGTTVTLSPDDVVLDDVVLLAPGDQVVADAVVLEQTELTLDESMLTGESEPVQRQEGEPVLSGSSVAAGTALVRVTAVGAEAYAAKLTAEIRRHSLAFSELRGATNRILVYVSWILAPIVVVVLASRAFAYTGSLDIRALFIDDRWRDALLDLIASVVGMIPEGLVLLISLAFGVAAIRLAAQRVLVQELAAVEILARVDVLCLDKTGTLTDGTIVLDEVTALGDDARFAQALGAIAADESANATARALRERFAASAGVAARRIPFSSSRGWSGVELADGSAWLLGAPERLLPDGEVRERASWTAAEGRRTLALVQVERLPDDVVDQAGVRPAALLVFAESLRPDAAETLGFFARQGVRVLVLSGDAPDTVSALVRRLDVEGEAVDARTLSDDDALARALATSTVFGRVTPDQKRAIVRMLQRDGHTVAVTGDGVNDAMAIKDADLGIAMGSATPATRAVSRIVLLDDRFEALPSVLAYGRRVIANVERVANLYLAKTVYGILFAVAFAALLVPFGFLPRQLTLVSTLTIGIPSFVLALAPNGKRYVPGILRRLTRYAAATGVVAAATAITVYLVGLRLLPLPEARTAATVALFVVAFWVLCVLCRPLDRTRSALLGAMLLLFAATFLVPFGREFFALEVLPVPAILLAVAGGSLGAVGIEAVYRVARRAGLVFDREPQPGAKLS